MGNKAGKIALGLGLLTGALTGLLFAPEDGKKVRQKIKDGDGKGLLKDLEHMGEEIKDLVVEISKKPSVKEALENAKDKAADVANMKRTELDSLLKKASTTADKFKHKISAYVKEQKGALEEHMNMKNGGKKASKPAAKKTASKKMAPKKTAAKKPAKKSTKKKK